MRRIFLIAASVCLPLLMLLFAACKKSSSANTTIEYQVSTTNSSNISIMYTNAAGDTLLTTANTSFVLDLTNLAKPFNAYIQASSSSPFSSVTTTCTVNILVNGSTVKTATASSNSVAVAEADYKVQ